MLRTVKIPLVLLVLFASSAGLVDAQASLAGDLSDDGAVDWQDMRIFAGQWLDAPGCAGHPDDCADLVGNDGVNGADFAVLAQSWHFDAKSALRINELMASNDSIIQDPQGHYDDWIEIYNPTSAAIDIGGLHLADNQTQWMIPDDRPGETTISAYGYLLIWADDDIGDSPGLHAGFKLSASNGDEVTLYDTDGVTEIDSVEFGPQITDWSYGRYPDGVDDWYTMSDPTPEAANTMGTAGKVWFSRLGGTFTDSFSLELSTVSDTATIYYTTNGSIPTDSSTLYTGPITINNSQTRRIRARAYDTSLLPGPVTSHAYLPLDADVQSFNSNLPVVVLDTFGFDIDTEHEPSIDYDPRPVAAAFIDTDPNSGRATITGLADFAGRAGLKVRGDSSASDWMAASWARQYSFETWTEVDEEDKNVSILGFPAESDWILHIPFDDKSLMRNVLAYKWSNAMGNYASRTKFVELFLNKNGDNVSMSDYWGIYILMEKIKWDDNRVDIARLSPDDNTEPEITGGYIIKHDKYYSPETGFTTTQNKTGTFLFQDPKYYEVTTQQKAWIKGYLDELETALYGSSFTDPVSGYAKYMDVNTFIDFFWIVEMTKQVDSYVYSTYMYKDRNGKLKMGPVWDFNIAFGNAGPTPGQSWYFYWQRETLGWYYAGLGGGSGTNVWYNRLREDAEYNLKCADRWFELRESRFNDANINADLDYYYNLLSAEAAARNFDRWQFYVDPDTGMEVESGGVWASILNAWTWPNWYYGTPNDPHTYQMEVEWTKNWLTGEGTPAPGETYDPDYTDRLGWMDDNMPFGLPPQFYVDGSGMDTGGHADTGDELTMSKGGAPGTIYYTLDGTDPREPVTGSVVGTAYSSGITLSESVIVKARIYNSGDWSALNSATFAVGPVADNLRITEIMYHPQDAPTGDPNAEFVEVKNVGAETINVKLVSFTNGVYFTFGSLSLNSGEYAVVVKDPAAFAAEYPSFSGTIAGTYTASLDNGGEEIDLDDAYGTEVLDFDYDDDWYPITDGHGFSLNMINPTSSDPNDWDQAENWQASNVLLGTPGAGHTLNTVANGAIVINEVLTHTDEPVYGDWIELHNTTGSPINIAGWFLSDDRDELKKYEVQPGDARASIGGNSYVVFNAETDFRDETDPGSHIQFGLSELGEQVYVSSGSGGDLAGGYSIWEDFGAADNDVTFGRHTKSAASGYDVDFVSMASATKGSANGSPLVGPIVINEIMYNPSAMQDELGEYIELKNISGGTVELYDVSNPENTWKFTDGIDYVFPEGITLGAGEYLLVVRTDPDIFKQVYSVPGGVQVLGPFEHDTALNNAGEKVEISKPGAPEPGGYVPYIRVDRVKYSDGSHPQDYPDLPNDPWPTSPDGGGDSLHRTVPGDYGNDVANWNAAGPTPGQ